MSVVTILNFFYHFAIWGELLKLYFIIHYLSTDYMKFWSAFFILWIKSYVRWYTFSAMSLCLDLFTIIHSLHECDDCDLLTD